MPTVEDENKKSGVGDKKQNVTVTNDGKRNINSNLETEENPKNGRKCKEEEDMTGPYSHIIKFKNFKISEANLMFINASLSIADGKRYGLVGLESCGINALLKHIANIPSGIDVLHWNEGIVDHMLPANKAVSKPSTRYDKLLAECENLIAEQHNGNDTENIRNRLAELREEILMIDPEGTPAREKAAVILCGLGFPYEDIDETIINLPEHLRKRVSLARALHLEPALLILVEPTTELDLDAVLWLENYLQDWKKTLIVVSQDRCFLDNVCNEIIYVNQQQLLYYKGNHSFFEKVFAQKQRRSLKKKEKRKEKKIQLKADEKSRDTGVKTRAMSRSKSQNGYEVNGSGEGKEFVKLLQKPEFSFCDPIDFKRREFLKLMGISFGYKKEEGEEKDGKEDEDELLFECLGLSISHRSRVVVLGPSRAGKSTLLKIVNKELNVQEGRVYLEPWAIIGKFSQNDVDCLPSEESPLQYLCGKAVDQKSFRQKAVEKLIGLGLPNNRHSTKMEKLTVNEKALVALAKLCLFPHDLLLLDEPTKNMSMDLIDALANAINQFKGAVLLVTNNQFLIRETESDLDVIDGKALDRFDTFEEYRRKLLIKLDEPIRGPFIFKKRTEFKREISPTRVISDSEIILNYIDGGDNVDPTIKNIGEYKLIFRECTYNWTCYSPTLKGCRAAGRTKEICQKNMRDGIERWIEMLISNGEYVPPPP